MGSYQVLHSRHQARAQCIFRLWTYARAWGRAVFISWATSVAVLAVGMARLVIDAAFAAPRCVTPALQRTNKWKSQIRKFESTGQLSQTPKQQGEGCYITFGPQRACLVTQQISVLHIKQQSQSQPSFFWTMTSQRGHFMASPFCSMFYDDTGWNQVTWKSCQRQSFTQTREIFKKVDGQKTETSYQSATKLKYDLKNFSFALCILVLCCNGRNKMQFK